MFYTTILHMEDVMFKIFPIILLLSIITVFSNAQEPNRISNQISVFGSVELKEIANQASFTFSVKGVGSSLRHAVEDANKKVKVVTDKLFHLGVLQRNIATSQFYSSENSGDKAFLSSSRDYQATLTTLVTVDSLPLLEGVLYATSESDIQSVSNISFSIKDELDVRKRARVAAAKKAREKAEDIASALGVTLGQVVSVEETEPTKTMNLRGAQNNPNPFNPSALTVFKEDKSTIDESRGRGFFAQTVIVTSQLRAIFEIKGSL